MDRKIDYKIYKSPSGWYTMVVPGHWQHMVIEGIPAFFEENGAGAMQVYAFENKDGTFDAEKELERYLGTHGIPYESDKAAFFDNNLGARIIACEFLKEDGRHWMVYLISAKKRMVLVTYNGDESPTDELAEQLTTMVSSIRISE
ncbi:hypothetical protein ACE5IS_02500 [Leptospira wolffii]|uniref:DUF3805 domain-containing protein n=1 Tax=Leptospira wolffii TaxID=409998 RepID=A0ABV5BKA3_9LEPT|nr:hypothetical protein [Leptospira wolffii]EPG64402.1 hypothetical protein LEP1GSC061_3708 [Leptospira wolffii serovar Khorat str. Khorat-H2]TGL49428.1 hypothetical protein EHQ61_13355 [Leptospira wolffii]